jgi:hypothetical protein
MKNKSYLNPCIYSIQVLGLLNIRKTTYTLVKLRKNIRTNPSRHVFGQFTKTV